MLNLTVEELGHVTVLRCSGRIVRGKETEILCIAVRHRKRDIVLDLSGVDSIDAAGIGALVSLQAAGIYLKLANPKRHVREVLKITKGDSILEICEFPPTEATGAMRERVAIIT